MHEVPVQGHGGIVQKVGEDGVPAKRCYECRHIRATEHQEGHDLSWEQQKLLGKTCQLISHSLRNELLGSWVRCLVLIPVCMLHKFGRGRPH